jgi:hypothetical protein
MKVVFNITEMVIHLEMKVVFNITEMASMSIIRGLMCMMQMSFVYTMFLELMSLPKHVDCRM